MSDSERLETHTSRENALRLRGGMHAESSNSAPAAAMPQSSSTAPSRSADRAWMLIFGAWVIASASTLGALFFSEIMELPPCVLCWYQRIFMFPLVLLLPVGLFPFDKKIVRYGLPLALGGWLISIFHVLLVAGLIPESMKPCTQGVPCTEVQIQWLGFVSIPLLSFIAFSVISALIIVAHFRISK